jgi:hypothetical protein
MKKFKSWLTEAISAAASDAVNKIILSYLKKKLGGKVYKMPGVEEFQNSTGRGYGVRYFYGGNKSLRFNWKGANISAFTLDSVDVWDGTRKDPNWHMEFEAQASLVKTLPTIVDFAMKPFAAGTFYAIPADNLNEDLDFGTSVISEGVASEQDAFDVLMKELKPNTAIPVAALEVKFGWRLSKVLTFIRNEAAYKDWFTKAGRTLMFAGTADNLKTLENNKDNIMSGLGAVKVTVKAGGTSETYAPTEQEKEIEAKGIERVAYEEQLVHLAILLKLVVKGASNALFVAGRGGTGKTQTIEAELAKAGLQDGNGYYKNTGSASPVGLYTTLFDNRSDIVLFDDCDSALADQEGRNLIKAATDTKKIRKVAWNKKSSMIVPRDQFEQAEDSADGERPTTKDGSYIYPNSFEFSGRVIFISNLKLDKLDPDGALRTRGFIIEIDPTDAELIDYMAKIAPKIKLENGGKLQQSEIDEVVGVIRDNTKKTDVSLRKLVRGLNVKGELRDDPMCTTIIKLYA